jgi:flagellar protein FlaJ
MAITFERLVSRSIVTYVSDELDLSGVKMTVNAFFRIAILGGFAIFIAIPLVLLLYFKFSAVVAAFFGFVGAAAYEILLYVILEFQIERRKTFVETLLPDYLQLVAANIRSGISLDRAMLLASKPEFGYFKTDVEAMNKQLYSGETMQNALNNLSRKYRSTVLQHSIRLILEAVRYGGALTDLLNQIAKDTRSQQTIQKEISGQLFMYTIFIAFAAIMAAPALYGLTYQMITITDKVWAGILAQNPGGLPTAGLSFLKPSPPQITPGMYYDFSIVAIIIITGFGSFTIATISSGAPLRGIRYAPAFVVLGIVIFFVVAAVIGALFSSIGSV